MMLRFIYPNGVILEATDEASQQLLLEEQQHHQVYTVTELAVRLRISERSAYDLVRNGEIAYACCGAKNYRIGEPAVRRFLLGLIPLK
ncbi:helix-turn-helix domain-containing protein [Hymenobacter bucti]|uniref:Helix-turn-helix domain-containing protein n=1 Tax=Hymenobacter bucti TaxID=1844114 RepID=A0ABW4QWM7_9BACT